MFLSKWSYPYHTQWWPWARRPATLHCKRDIMQQTEVCELWTGSEWAKAVVRAGRKPRGSAWIHVIIENRRCSICAWPVRADKWYVSIQFRQTTRRNPGKTSSSKWRPVLDHGHRIRFQKNYTVFTTLYSTNSPYDCPLLYSSFCFLLMRD